MPEAGRLIVEVVSAGHGNEPDPGASIAQRWLDTEAVDAIVDVAAATVALTVGDIVRDRNRVLLGVGPGMSDPVFAPGRLRSNGRKLNEIFLFETKAPAEGNGDWDASRQIEAVPAGRAFRPLDQRTCRLTLLWVQPGGVTWPVARHRRVAARLGHAISDVGDFAPAALARIQRS